MTIITKHTPGHWTVCDNTSQMFGQLTVDSERDGAVAVCFTASSDEHNAPLECFANARLIAAAPELLIALRALLQDAIELGIYEGNMSGSAVAARNAIDKATGGAA